jgi:bleomycin hydrolase
MVTHTNASRRYGLVPQTLYPDSFNAQSSSAMDRLLTTKLREDGLVLRALVKQDASSSRIVTAKETMMQDIIRILTLTLGPPPAASEKFSWEFYDEKGSLKSVSLTPLELAKEADVKKFISLVNDPRNEYNSLVSSLRCSHCPFHADSLAVSSRRSEVHPRRSVFVLPLGHRRSIRHETTTCAIT